jgi:hypothetical protein
MVKMMANIVGFPSMILYKLFPPSSYITNVPRKRLSAHHRNNHRHWGE